METELLFHGVEQCSRSEMDQMDRISRVTETRLTLHRTEGNCGDGLLECIVESWCLPMKGIAKCGHEWR